MLADLRAGGTPLALLSNAGPDYGSYFRHGPLGDFFSACYVSGELGLLKPHAEIYRHVLDDLRITPAEAIFIDNRESNVTGAEALGITGHVFTGAERLRAFLIAASQRPRLRPGSPPSRGRPDAPPAGRQSREGRWPRQAVSAGGASGGRTVVTVPSPHMIITQAGTACPCAAGGHGALRTAVTRRPGIALLARLRHLAARADVESRARARRQQVAGVGAPAGCSAAGRPPGRRACP